MSAAVTIAYVGLGIMGRPTASHLVKAGHRLQVWARRPESAAPLVELGATLCDSPATAAQGADFAFTNVADTPDVEEVIFGTNGYAAGLAAGSLAIDMSTIAPAGARSIGERLRVRDIGFLDAPVSGGEAGAQAGTLAFMCGGSAADYAKALPLFEIMGASMVHVGDCGAGSVAKCANQIIIGAAVDAIAEAFQLARGLDVDPAKVRAAIAGGFAGSKVLDVHGQRILNADYTPGFKARLHLKDIDIALTAGRECGVELPSAEIFRSRLVQVIEAGMGELDSAVAARALE